MIKLQMDKLGRSIKTNPLAWGVGAVVAAFGIYMIVDWTRTRNNAIMAKKMAEVSKARSKVSAAKRNTEPRGKLPWAIGDVNLWDDEDQTYCSVCSKKCSPTNNTEECIRCRERCPMN